MEAVLSAPRERASSSLDEARAFLREVLHTGSQPAREVETAATARGISKVTLKRAKQELGVESIKLPGQHGAWRWSLPSAPPPVRAASHPGDQEAGMNQMIPLNPLTPFAEPGQTEHGGKPHTGGDDAVDEGKGFKGIMQPGADPLIPLADEVPATDGDWEEWTA